MELKCIEFGYRDNKALILPGETTEGGLWTNAEKRVMFDDHPGRFEVIEGSLEDVDPIVEPSKEGEFTTQTPEDGLTIETPEAKLKTRKK